MSNEPIAPPNQKTRNNTECIKTDQPPREMTITPTDSIQDSRAPINGQKKKRKKFTRKTKSNIVVSS